MCVLALLAERLGAHPAARAPRDRVRVFAQICRPHHLTSPHLIASARRMMGWRRGGRRDMEKDARAVTSWLWLWGSEESTLAAGDGCVPSTGHGPYYLTAGHAAIISPPSGATVRGAASSLVSSDLRCRVYAHTSEKQAMLRTALDTAAARLRRQVSCPVAGWTKTDGRGIRGAGEEGSDSTAEPRAAQTHARMHCPSPAAVDIEESHPAPRHGRRIREGGPHAMPCHATERADDETGSSNKSSSRRARVRASATGGGAGEIALGLAGCCASPADEEAQKEPPSSALRTVISSGAPSLRRHTTTPGQNDGQRGMVITRTLASSAVLRPSPSSVVGSLPRGPLPLLGKRPTSSTQSRTPPADDPPHSLPPRRTGAKDCLGPLLQQSGGGGGTAAWLGRHAADQGWEEYKVRCNNMSSWPPSIVVATAVPLPRSPITDSHHLSVVRHAPCRNVCLVCTAIEPPVSPFLPRSAHARAPPTPHSTSTAGHLVMPMSMLMPMPMFRLLLLLLLPLLVPALCLRSPFLLLPNRARTPMTSIMCEMMRPRRPVYQVRGTGGSQGEYSPRRFLVARRPLHLHARAAAHVAWPIQFAPGPPPSIPPSPSLLRPPQTSPPPSGASTASNDGAAPPPPPPPKAQPSPGMSRGPAAGAQQQVQVQAQVQVDAGRS
ncbi:hypothetical protein Purlil1_4243 [Purpureocillium lilacinum]|uniref:Uncharacterized protein n=1 Tax=Purpureocillium lilacinum TaxID=33203 RepID=A0ABR0C4F0_PURLI|nr:hypothetical protein Purlil1_4243 [Purpureocillium lilacinum]